MGIEFLDEESSQGSSNIEFIDGQDQRQLQQGKRAGEDVSLLGSQTLGDIFIRPGAAIRAGIQAMFTDESPIEAYKRGSLKPSSVPSFQELAIDNFAPKTDSFLLNAIGGQHVSTVGFAVDILTNPADLLLMLAPTAPAGQSKTIGKAIAETKLGKEIGRVLTSPLEETQLAKGIKSLAKGKPTPAQQQKLLAEAQKLTTEILQPTAKEIANSLRGGAQLPAVEQGARVISQSKSYPELLNNLKNTTDDIFRIRNQRIAKNNRPVNDNYLKEATDLLESQRNKGQFKASEIREIENVIQRERDFLKANKGFDRVGAQQRKEFFQSRTENILKKRQLGTITEKESARALTEDALRSGLKRVVEAGDPVLSSINSTYGGLLRAQELAAVQAGLAERSIPPSFFQRISKLFSKRGIGETVVDAATSPRSLAKKTRKIESLTRRAGQALSPEEFL